MRISTHQSINNRTILSNHCLCCKPSNSRCKSQDSLNFRYVGESPRTVGCAMSSLWRVVDALKQTLAPTNDDETIQTTRTPIHAFIRRSNHFMEQDQSCNNATPLLRLATHDITSQNSLLISLEALFDL